MNNFIKNTIFLFFVLNIYVGNVFGEVDTLIVYDVRTNQINIINPPEIDTTQIWDNTSFYYGQQIGFSTLSLSPPVITPPNSGFTDLIPAHSMFDVTNYPIRFAVKLFRFASDTLAHCCSGVLVAKKLVLTSAHCIYFQFDTSGVRTFSDSILVIPAFDNGIQQPTFGSSVSAKYYIPKTWYYNEAWDDIALIELQDTIGLMTGWIGIAFNEDSSFFQNNVFHKLSYPAAADPSNPARVFNGDTLYYNYGTLDLILDNYLGFNLTGIPGQSGSSLFYTDNLEYYTFGVLAWAGQSKHYRIDRNTFYVFDNIIETHTTSINDNGAIILSKYILEQNFPNPFNSTTIIKFTILKSEKVTLEIFNIIGQKIKTIINKQMPLGTHTVEFSASDLPSGVYLYTIEAGDYHEVKKMIYLK